MTFEPVSLMMRENHDMTSGTVGFSAPAHFIVELARCVGHGEGHNHREALVEGSHSGTSINFTEFQLTVYTTGVRLPVVVKIMH